MDFTENTRLAAIMEAYPELTDRLMKDERISELAASPLAKILMKKATILDASRISGIPVQELIEELKRLTAHK